MRLATHGFSRSQHGHKLAMRWLARIVLGAAIAVQASYQILTYQATSHTVTWWYGTTATVCFFILAVSGSRWFAGILRVALGLTLAASGLSQLGVHWISGQLGSSLEQFLTSAGFSVKLDILVPASLTHVLTPRALLSADVVCQLIVAAALVTGLWGRFFSLLAALLLALYGVAWFLLSGPMLLVIHALPVIWAGMLVFATWGSSLELGWRFSHRRAETDPFISAFDEAQRRAAQFRRTAHRVRR